MGDNQKDEVDGRTLYNIRDHINRGGTIGAMKAVDIKTGKPCRVLCILMRIGENLVRIPMARMFDVDPALEISLVDLDDETTTALLKHVPK
jgi:hypothetical protein